jgi:hypothetical protein
MNRHVAAFLLAPLTVPLLMSVLALQILREVPSLYWFGLLIASVVSYGGALLVGAPAYVTLRSCGWTAFWLAPVIGSMAGMMMAIALVVIFPLAQESGILTSLVQMFAYGAHWGEIFITKPGPAEALLGPGILGVLVGTVLWFIGRPDRP